MRSATGALNISAWTIRRAAARRLAARCLEALFALALLVTLTFFLAHAAPGGPAYAILGARVTPASAAEVSVRLGVNVPVWQQYLLWWWHILHGDLGNSYVQARPVAAVIGECAGQSAWLYLTGLGLVMFASLTAGVAHGVWYRGWSGTVFSYVETFLYAMPGFFIATLLAMVFATWLGWLPAGGVSNLRLAAPGAGDILRHLILPAASIMLFASPGLARMFAESVDQELAAAYVRTARARGLPYGTILIRHVLPNAVRPLITLLGFSLPAIFSGSVAVESVFDYPGLGWLLWRSALAHDYPVLIGIVLLVGIATSVGSLAADLLNSAIDPRTIYV